MGVGGEHPALAVQRAQHGARERGRARDERLREREFGVFDRLTTLGIREKYPEEAEHRKMLGKFYHRPPGGESWADVILRLRGALDTISLHHADRRVLIVCHQVVVLCLRYILEEMDEAQILAIDREADELAVHVREGCLTMPDPAPLDLFEHVYAEPTPQLREQREILKKSLGILSEPPLRSMPASKS